MPLFSFKDKEKDTTGAYLAGAGALAALPASEIAIHNLGASYAAHTPEELKTIGSHISFRDANLLKKEILKDPELAKQLPMIYTNSPANLLSPYRKHTYVPTNNLEVLKNAINLEGPTSIRGVGGEDLAISDFIKRVRNTGAYINLNPENANIVDLAHELGHARAFSPSSTRANKLDLHHLNILMGRLNPKSRLIATGAATAAALLQDDPTSPMVYAPAAVLAATQAPILREEYLASSKAYDAIHKLEQAGMLNKGLANIAALKYSKALGTYGAMAAGMAAVPALAALARQRYNTEVDKDTEEESSNTGLSVGKALGIGAAGSLLGLGAYALAPKALSSGARYTRDFLDDLIEKKMAKGEEIDEAVEAINKATNPTKAKKIATPPAPPAPLPYQRPYPPTPPMPYPYNY